MGLGHVNDKEDQDSFCFSLGECFHLISYWGKTCRTWRRGEALSWRVQNDLDSLSLLEQVQGLAGDVLAPWLGEHTH